MTSGTYTAEEIAKYLRVHPYTVKMYEDIIFVMVKLVDTGKDKFHILRYKNLQKIICQEYKAFLDSHNGRRPLNPASTHTKVSVDSLKPYLDNRELLRK